MDEAVLAGLPVDEPLDVDALLPSDEDPPDPAEVDEALESLELDPLDDDPFDDEPAVTDEPERESVR